MSEPLSVALYSDVTEKELCGVAVMSITVIRITSIVGGTAL
jgi:hypothetical protein